MIKEKNSGLSLIEILVVIGIFAILGVLTTRSVVLTLTGGKKTETLIKVRENLDYALGIIERQLRNADSITDCTNTNTLSISYKDQEGVTTSFSCSDIAVGSVGYVSSGSARLTSSTVDVTACSFVCESDSSGNPRAVKVTFKAEDSTFSGVNNSEVPVSTSVTLRNY